MSIYNESGVALIIEESPAACGRTRTKIEDNVADSRASIKSFCVTLVLGGGWIRAQAYCGLTRIRKRAGKKTYH